MKIKYTNENILKQVKANSDFFKGIIVMMIISLLLVISGPVITYIQRQKQAPLPADDPKTGFGIYYAQLTEMPQELGSGYYAAEIDGHKIILSFGNHIYRQIRSELRRDGVASIHGTFSYISRENDDESKQAARKIFESVYLPRTIEEHGYYYFNCIDGSLLYESFKIHPVGLVFAITIWILVALICHWEGTLNMIKHLHPACGKTKYTQEQIDEQANMEKAVWLPSVGIYLAPEIMIGTQKGVTAVKYDEIVRIRIKSKYHVMEKRDYYTYRLIVKTTNGRRLIFSDSTIPGTNTNFYDQIYQKCLEQNPYITIEEPKED